MPSLSRSLALVLAFLAALWIAGCSGGSGVSTTGNDRTPTGELVVEHPLGRAQGRTPPPHVDQLEISGFTLEDGLVMAPSKHDFAQTVRVHAPVTTRIVRILYLSGGVSVGFYEGLVEIQADHTTTISDPPYVTLPSCHIPADDSQGQYGAVLTDEGVQAPNFGYPQALPARATPGNVFFGHSQPQLPSKVQVSGTPPIGMQGTLRTLGSPGSCISWSYAYGLGGFTASRNPDGTQKWDLADEDNQISTAQMYRRVHHLMGEDCPKGSTDYYLPLLVMTGSANVAEVPYFADCCYLDALDPEQAFPDAGRLRLGSYGTVAFPAGKHKPARDYVLQQLKEYLASGHVVAFAGPVYEHFDSLPIEAGVFYSDATVPNSGHGMLLVGYDDEVGLGTPDKPKGAFLVQNSFGTVWPALKQARGTVNLAPPGMFYVSYDTFFDVQLGGAVATPVDAATPGTPALARTGTGPAAHVMQAWQYTEPGQAWLAVKLWFGGPVTVDSVTMREPSGARAATQHPNAPYQNGVVFLRRADGKSFGTGTWHLSVTGRDGTGDSATWTGEFTLAAPNAGFPQHPAAALPDVVFGTTGGQAAIED